MKSLLSVSICLALVSTATYSSEKPHFDGTWDTTLSCSNTAGAIGYSFRFSPVVKDAALHAEKGVKGQPGWLEINGKVLADGSATLYADGLVGPAEAAVGHRPPGTEYGYHINAKFNAQDGAGKRVEGRPCQVVFTRAK